MQYQCSLCKQKIGSDMIEYVKHAEQHIVEIVKSDHPDWVEQNGMCAKCLEYYRSEMKGSIFKDAACVKRNRKIKSFVKGVKGLFRKGSKINPQ